MPNKRTIDGRDILALAMRRVYEERIGPVPKV